VIESQYITEIKNRLGNYKKLFFRRELIKGIAICLIFLLASYFLISSLEFWGHFSTSVRTLLFFGFLFLAIGLLGYLVILPTYNLLTAHRKMSDKEAAEQLGQFFPAIQDKLLNMIQLQNVENTSSELILASIAQKSQELSPFSFQKAIDFKSIKKHLVAALAIILFLLLIFFVKKDIFTQGSKRVIQYSQYFETPAPFRFLMLNQSLEVARNESFEFQLKLEGKAIPDQSKIMIDGKSYLMKKNEEGIFSFKLKNVKENLSFQYNASGYYSALHQLNVIDKPSLNYFSITIDYPTYQHRKSETIENTGSFHVSEGAKVSWEADVQHTDYLLFVFDTLHKQLASKTKNNIFKLSKKVRNNTTYAIVLDSTTANANKSMYEINVIKDQYPTLNVTTYSDSVLNNYVLLSGNISDDYGFSRLEVIYEISNQEKTIKTDKITIKKQFSSANERFNYVLNLDSIGLSAGENIKYGVAVWDNDGINGAKKTQSSFYTLELPSQSELESAIAQSEKKQDQELASLKKELDQLQDELEKIQERLKVKKQIDWQDKKQIERIIQKQKEVQEKIENAQKNHEEKELKKEQLNQKSPEKESNLSQQMMNELKDEEMDEILEELQKLLSEKNNTQKLNKELKKLQNQNKINSKNVERTKELLKKQLVKEKLEKAISDLEKLSKEEKELSEKTKNQELTKQESKEQQEKLRSEFEKLEKEIQKMEEINRSLERPNKMSDTQSERSEIKEQMQKAEESSESGNQKKASEQQQKAAEQMQQMQQKMKQMQQQMEMKVLQENIETLQIILDNLIKLSLGQEEIMDKLAGVPTTDPVFIEYSQKQVQLNENASIVEDSLFALAKRAAEIRETVLEETQKVSTYMQESLDAIQKRNTPLISTKQQYAMTSMNNLALLLSDILNNMQAEASSQPQQGEPQQGEPQQGEEGQGKQSQPQSGQQKQGEQGEGEGDPKDGVGNQQEQLNQGIQELSEGQKSGRELSQELAKLAAQQEKIRRAIKKLENEQGQGSALKEELSKLQKLMEETEKDLVFKQVDQQTLQRQKDILTRLFKAEKASRTQGLEEKREAERGHSFKGKYPPAIEKYLNEKRKQTELLRTVPPSLTPFYEQKVNDYFERIDKN